MDHTHIRAYFLAIVTTILVVLSVYMLRPFLVTVGLAAVFAVIFMPVHVRLQRAKLSETMAALGTLLFGVICVAVPFTFLSTQLLKEAQNVYSMVSQPGSVAHAQTALINLGQVLEPRIPGAGAYLDSLATSLPTYARNILSNGFGYAGAIFSGTLSFILQFFVFMMTLYYFLKEGPRLKSYVNRFSPLTNTETAKLIDRQVITINSVVRGTFLIALIQGALTALGFLFFGISNAVLWGSVAIIGALIPSIGVALVFVPAVLYLFFVGNTISAIGLGIFGLFGVGVIDNLLRPYLVGGRASIHPLLILLSVLGGLAFFGPGGLFLGPLVISILLGLLSIYTPSRTESTA